MESIEDLNKALVRRVYTEWWDAAGNVASVDEMVREDFIGHLDDGSVRTIDTLRDTIVMFQTGFEGLHEVVEDMIAEADRVVVRYSMFGRHSGEVFGAKATGKAIVAKGIEIFRIQDGKIAEFWHFGTPINLG